MGFNPYDPNRKETVKQPDAIPYAVSAQKTVSESLFESINWSSPEFNIQPTDKTVVKIKGIAIPKNAISRNHRAYLSEEMKMASRTFIDCPITRNHSDFNDKKNQLGKINWMEYNPEDGSMEYVGEVWNPAAAAELKLYAHNPAASKIAGVSIEADFLSLKCSRCHQHFTSQQEWADHMQKVEGIKEGLQIPHGIRGRALSLVYRPESPGVIGNTLTVFEKTEGFGKVYEMLIKEHGLETEVDPVTKRIEQPKKIIIKDPVAENLALTEKAPEPYRAAFKFLLIEADKTVLEWKAKAENTPQYQEQQRLIKETHDKQETQLTESSSKIQLLETERKTLSEKLSTQENTLTEKTLLLSVTAEKLNAKETAYNDLSTAHQTLTEKFSVAADKAAQLTLTEEKLSTQEKAYSTLSNENRSLSEKVNTLTAEVQKRENLVAENKRLIIENENLKDKQQPYFKGKAKETVKPRETPTSFNPYASDFVAPTVKPSTDYPYNGRY